MISGIDHALVAVSDVERTTEAYRELGFEVTRGGEHPGAGTHNALVPLADGFYFELIGVHDRALAEGRPLGRRVLAALARENRFAQFALESDDLPADVAALRAAGVEIGDPVAGGRMRPDGQRLEWRAAIPISGDLPFLIEDLTPRALRVPAPNSGLGRVARLGAITVSSTDLEEARGSWRALMGRDPVAGSELPSGRGAVRLLPAFGGESGIAAVEVRVTGLEDWLARLRSHGSRTPAGHIEVDPAAAAGARLVIAGASGGMPSR